MSKTRAAVDKFKNDQSVALKMAFSTGRLQRELFALHFPKNLYALFSGSARKVRRFEQKQEESEDAKAASAHIKNRSISATWTRSPGLDSGLGDGPILDVQSLRLGELLGQEESRARE